MGFRFLGSRVRGLGFRVWCVVGLGFQVVERMCRIPTSQPEIIPT